MNKPRIIISVYGGLVQDVFCSIPDAEVVLVDWDQDPDPPFPRPEIVQPTNCCSALVGAFHAHPLDEMARTDVEAAIIEAQEQGVIDEEIFVVS